MTSAVSTYTDSGKAITASRFVVLDKIVLFFETYHFIFTSLIKIKTCCINAGMNFSISFELLTEE